MMTQLNLVNTLERLPDLLKQLEDSNPIILNEEGEAVAALITMKDLSLFQKLVEAEEDRIDAADADKTLSETKEEDWISLEDLRTELSL